jgi:outer membrane protein
MQEEINTNPGTEAPVQEKIAAKETAPGNTLVKVSLAFNIILLIGLIILYILHFNPKKTDESSISPALKQTASKGVSVVFVNIDSLNTRYEFVKKLKNDLESTGKRMQNEMLSEQATLQKEADDFQKKVQANAISEEKAKMQYEELMKKQQALMEKKDRYTQQVADQELSLNIRLLDTVTNFLKRYNAKYHYDYILAHKTAGEILIANDTLDITNEVVKALNDEYQATKK